MYFYALGAVYRFITSENHHKTFVITELVLVLLFTLVFCLQPGEAEYLKSNSMTAFRTLVNGEAAYYEQQQQERLAVLKDASVLDVTFAPYDVPESLMYFLYLGDISENENAFVNQRMAEIYGKTSIRILRSDEK